MDEVYSKPAFYWGKEPNGLCLQVLDLMPSHGQRAIDLGCGEGRDLIQFARHGFEAVGVDLSAPGLAKAARWAEAEGLQVETIQANMNSFRLDRPYDLVYASGVLTYLSPELRPEIIANYKRFTPPGGIHAFNAFVEKPFIPTPPDWGAHEHFFRSGELLQYYWDWEILHTTEVIFACNSSGVPHRHAMTALIARRPA